MISMTHQRYMTEQIRKIPVVRQIQEAIGLCMKAGREPIALVVNPKVLNKLHEDPLLSTGYSSAFLSKLFGLPIFLANVKDFYLVDNRSWAEQKF